MKLVPPSLFNYRAWSEAETETGQNGIVEGNNDIIFHVSKIMYEYLILHFYIPPSLIPICQVRQNKQRMNE